MPSELSSAALERELRRLVKLLWGEDWREVYEDLILDCPFANEYPDDEEEDAELRIQ